MTTNINRDKGISTLPNSSFNTTKETPQFITPDEARDIFSFKVEKEQSYRPNGTAIDGQYHLIRKDGLDDEGIVIGASGVGRQFDVDIQPSHVLDFFLDQILPEMSDLHIETVAAVRNGAITMANFHFGGAYSIPNDTSEQYTNIVFVNPLTTGRMQILSHNLRVSCCNTIAGLPGHGGVGFRVSHTKSSKVLVDHALKAIQAKLTEAERLKQSFIALANVSCTKKNIENILNEIYPCKRGPMEDELTGQARRAREEAVARLETDSTFTDKTGWAFLNAMTYPLEHAKETAKRSAINVASDNLFGVRADKKSKMLAACLKEFGIA